MKDNQFERELGVDQPAEKADTTIIFFKVIAVIIAVCTYRLVMISIERSETAQKSTLEI